MICGIDASTSCTGLCIFDEDDLVYYTKITPLSKHDKWEDNAIDILYQIIDRLKSYPIDMIYMEDVPQYAKRGTRGGVMIKTPIILGGVHLLFYEKLSFENGYSITFLNVDEWRQELGFLKGNQRDRESMKQKAVDFVNQNFGLGLHFVKGSKSKKNDDDIAESIAIVCSTKDKYRDKPAFGIARRVN